MHVKQLDHLNMTVGNIDETMDWYKRVFGFERVEGGVRGGVKWAIIRSGDALLCIYEYPDRAEPYAGLNRTTDRLHTVNHFGLRITDRESWETTIKRESVRVLYDGEIEYPHSTSWYVEDPTGYEIEVALWANDTVVFSNEDLRVAV